MIIVHLAAPQSTTGADFIYRVRQPDAALARLHGVTTVSLTNICSRRRELLVGADLVVMQMLGDSDLIPVILERRQLGRPTIFEVSDNFLAFQKSNPVAQFYADPQNRSTIFQLLSLCDAVQFTTPSLASLYGPYCRRVHVLQNQVASAEWVERSEGPLVVGWGGSVGHFDDVAEIAPAVSDWVRSNPSVRFKIMADEKFIPLFADIPPGQFEFVSTGSLDEYLAFVRGLDIGLAPLSDHPFNSCRTDGKFLEYASRGVISVCADMPSYSSTVSNGETGFLYKSTVDLINTLELLRTNAVVRHNVSKAGYHYVIQQRTENAAARHRLAFYRTLVAQGTESGSLTLQHIQSIPQIKPGDAHGHLLHELSDSEKLAYEGLVHQTNSDQSAAALKCLLQAIEKESSFFQAWLYAGTLLLDQDPASALDAITNALDLDPHSWLAAHKKAVALWRCGRAQEALNATRALQGTAPSFAPSFELEGEILMSLGQEAAATAALQQGIAANPFHSSALVRLGVLALNDGRPQDAEALFLKALDFNPDAANVLWGLAVALNAQHREDEAVKRCLSILQLTTTATPALTYIISIALKYLQANNFARASTLISEALGVAPNERDLLLWSNRIALLAKKAASNITAAHSSYF